MTAVVLIRCDKCSGTSDLEGSMRAGRTPLHLRETLRLRGWSCTRDGKGKHTDLCPDCRYPARDLHSE